MNGSYFVEDAQGIHASNIVFVHKDPEGNPANQEPVSAWTSCAHGPDSRRGGRAAGGYRGDVYADHRQPDGTGWVMIADPEGNLSASSAANRFSGRSWVDPTYKDLTEEDLGVAAGELDEACGVHAECPVGLQAHVGLTAAATFGEYFVQDLNSGFGHPLGSGLPQLLA